MWQRVAKQRRLNVREEEYIGKEGRNRGSEVSKEASQRFHQPELSKKSSGRISNYCRKTAVFHFLALSYLFLVISIPYKVHSSTFTVPISKSSDQQISEEHHLSINKKKSIQTPKTKALINSRGIGDSMVPSTFGTDRVGSDSSNNTSSTPGSNTASLNENETREIVQEDINSKENNIKFYGSHADVRSKLDYSYHSYYDESRTKLQDEIIAELLGSVVIQDSVHKNLQCSKPASNPWITFTAGAMGAGKTHTIRELVRHDLFPLDAFVIVDPDEIRRHLPEFPRLLEESPELAGEITRKEAGYISEILTWVALNHGYNVLVDGSLRDHEWYKEYFQSLRDSYPRLNIAIIHITAPREAVIHRAMVCIFVSSFLTIYFFWRYDLHFFLPHTRLKRNGVLKQVELFL